MSSRDLVQSPPAATPTLAIICESLPPYRVHLHRRIARELPQFRLATLVTHEPTDGRWELNNDPELNVTLLDPKHPAAGMRNLRNLPREWRKAGRVLRLFRSIRQTPGGLGAVIVHGYHDVLRLRVLSWCKKHNVPCFITGDSNIANDRATGVRRAVKGAAIRYVVQRLASGVMPFGSRGATYFRRYGADPHKIFFVPLEPDYQQFTHPMPTRAVDRLGLDPHRRRLLFCGVLVRLKRVDLLIDAFAAIARRRTEWDLLIVGDGPLRKTLEDRVPSDLKSRVIWAGAFRAAADVAALYARCDALVHPSEREAWALVINEAVAAGLAVISSSIPGAAAELVRDAVNGKVFPSGDLPALIAALDQVTDPNHIDAMKAASPSVLADWRRRGDPVQGLRDALRATGIDVAKPAAGFSVVCS